MGERVGVNVKFKREGSMLNFQKIEKAKQKKDISVDRMTAKKGLKYHQVLTFLLVFEVTPSFVNFDNSYLWE